LAYLVAPAAYHGAGWPITADYNQARINCQGFFLQLINDHVYTQN
jgi:hypothetical protein